MLLASYQVINDHLAMMPHTHTHTFDWTEMCMCGRHRVDVINLQEDKEVEPGSTP